MKTYMAVYGGSAVLSLIATALAIRAAKATGLLDVPNARKVHSRAIPRIGGVAIMTSTMVMLIAVLMLDNVIGQAFRNVQVQIIALLVGAVAVFAVGLLDDIFTLPASVKFICLVAASLAVCLGGGRIESLSVDSTYTLTLGALSWPITILWITGVTVAMNFIDGLDGLAAGIAAIVSAVIAVLALSSGQVVMAVVMIALLGSLTGFGFFNFNPAKIFMGDSGSMFVGFVIASGSVICQAKTATLVGIAIPALALGVPLFDMAFTLVRRTVLDRRSIFAAERGHIHHRLLDMGVSQKRAAVFLNVVTLLASGIGLMSLVARGAGRVAVVACGLGLLLIVFRLAGTSRLGETLAAIGRNSTIAHLIKAEKKHFEDAQLEMRIARNFDQWWTAACRLLERMEFAKAVLADGPGIGRVIRRWRRDQFAGSPPGCMDVVIPLVEPLAGAAVAGAVGAEFEADRSGGLVLSLSLPMAYPVECLGRRLSLFGRLVDEHNPSRFLAGRFPAPARTPAGTPARPAVAPRRTERRKAA